MGSNPTLCTLQEPQNFLSYLLTKTTLERGTIKRRVRALKSLAVHVDLFVSDSVVEFLNKCTWKNGTKNIVLLAYRDWLRMYGLPELKLRKFHVVQQLPFIPLESELDALISGSRFRLACFLELLKETGIRPIEAWRLEWKDFDVVQKTVNVRTAKHGNPRILPVTERFLNMLGGFGKRDDLVFSPSGSSDRFSIELDHFTRNFTKQRKRLADKLKSPRLGQISLYTFRHWKATMTYLKTRDIFFVKEMLGHTRIENTLKYVHVANAISIDQGNYSCKVARSIEEATALIESGFEYVTEIDGLRFFRKRK